MAEAKPTSQVADNPNPGYTDRHHALHAALNEAGVHFNLGLDLAGLEALAKSHGLDVKGGGKKAAAAEPTPPAAEEEPPPTDAPADPAAEPNQPGEEAPPEKSLSQMNQKELCAKAQSMGIPVVGNEKKEELKNKIIEASKS